MVAGGSLANLTGFTPDHAGDYTATLTIRTGQNAPIPQLASISGDAITIELHGTALVPEPASLALLAGGVGLLARRRRR